MAARMRQGMGSTEGQNVSRVLALLVGVSYVAAGVIGFAVTGFTGGFVSETDEKFLGFFDLNIFHNVVHLAIGAGLVLASRARDHTITQGVLIGVGLFYVLAAGLGFLNYLQLISINESLSFDNFFHLLTGGAALVFGLIGAKQQSDSGGGRVGREGPADGSQSIDERRAQWDTESTYRERSY